MRESAGGGGATITLNEGGRAGKGRARQGMTGQGRVVARGDACANPIHGQMGAPAHHVNM